MNDPQSSQPGQPGQPASPVNPRRRMQELLAIPDGQRTDEQWDELNELEIMLASGNRERPQGQPQQGARPPGNPAGGQPRPAGGGENGRRPARSSGIARSVAARPALPED